MISFHQGIAILSLYTDNFLITFAIGNELRLVLFFYNNNNN